MDCASLVARIALLWLLALGAAAAQEAPPGTAPALLLVATEELNDPNFHRSVVLVTRHGSDGGVVGLILNRATDVQLSRVFPSNQRLEKLPERLYFGGPVLMQMLVFLFRAEERPEGAIEVLPGIYISFDAELLRRLLARDQPTKDLRVFAGHSGWGPGQLENEISSGSWKLLPADAEALFRDRVGDLWQEMLKRAALRAVRLRGAGP